MNSEYLCKITLYIIFKIYISNTEMMLLSNYKIIYNMTYENIYSYKIINLTFNYKIIILFSKLKNYQIYY